jgi:hypothetical protein
MQKISDKARTHTAALLTYIEQGVPTRDDLETWWSKRHPVRLELHRLCRDLTDDGRLDKDGDTWRVPGKAPPPRKAPRIGDVGGQVIVEVKTPKGAKVPGAYAPAMLRGITANAAVAPPAEARFADDQTERKVTVILAEGKRSVVTLIGSPAAVFAMADAYQRQVAEEKSACKAPVAARKAPPAKPATPPKAPVRTALTPPVPTSAAGRILAALRKKPDDGPGLVRRLKMNSNTVRGRLSELARDGWIEMDAACLWEVAR